MCIEFPGFSTGDGDDMVSDHGSPFIVGLQVSEN
jgi:hypothetical protein